MAISSAQRSRYIEEREKRKEQEKELRKLAQKIVDKSKKEAHVDTGRLKRSIRYVIALDGIFTFTEMFYGQFYENSSLEENIKEMWPSNIPYKLIYQDENGQPAQVVRKTASGRAITTNATKATTRKSLGINGIKNFLNKLKGGKEKKKD